MALSRLDKIISVFLLSASVAFASSGTWTVTGQTGISYDSSVFRVDEGTLANQSSLVLNLEANANWKVDDVLQISYSAAGFLYPDVRSEDHILHNLTLRYVDSRWINFQSRHTYIQGSEEAVTYDMGQNAFSLIAPRERRRQTQNRTQFTAHIDHEVWIARIRGSMVYHDLDTVIRAGVPGYLNWINRYEAWIGFDLGKKLDGMDTYFGYRRGFIHQGRQGGHSTDRSNSYDRLIVGFSGKPLPWLTLNTETGVSFIRYSHSDSVGPDSKDSFFTSTRASAKISEIDELQVFASISHGVSSTGRTSNTYTQYRISHVRNWNPSVRTNINLGAFNLHYDGVARDDWLYFGEAALVWKKSEAMSLNLSIRQEEGRDGANTGQTSRDFGRTLLSLSADYRF